MPRICFLDYETFWSDDYTLRKMTPIEYLNDPRFEAHGCSFAWGSGDPFWVDGPDLPAYFASEKWSDTMMVSHNALFDGLITSIKFGLVPGMYGDTLSMARNILSSKLTSLSLDSVSGYYGLDAKWGTAMKTKGLPFAAIKADPLLYEELRNYAADDTLKCRTIFHKMLADGFPLPQLEVVDMVVRMAAVPRFELDANVLALHLADVQSKKAQLLETAGIHADDVSSIMSDKMLAVRLFSLGGEDACPMKISKTTGKSTFALAKTDKAFTALVEHDNPLIQALVAARLGHKSTLEETRTTRLLDISRVVDKMPVPLKYSGAHTHRLSGDWKLNMQNFPRGGQLRKALKAPKGKLVVSVDASQIEARINATTSGQGDLILAFANNEDVYASFAEKIYGYPVNKTDQPKERFVGKTSILSLGYGSSWPVFQNMVRVQGGINLMDGDAARIVGLYRTTYRAIEQQWRYASNVIVPGIAFAHQIAWSNSPIDVDKDVLLLPNGNKLYYRDLRRLTTEAGVMEWQYWRGSVPHRLYGAKVVENAIQALAFIHVMETAIRVRRLTNGHFLPAHQVHDELIYVVEEKHADMLASLVKEEMSRSPIWLPNAPLAAEAHIGPTYGDVK